MWQSDDFWKYIAQNTLEPLTLEGDLNNFSISYFSKWEFQMHVTFHRNE